MKVKDVMTKNVISIASARSLVDACKLMQEKNIGFLPVIDNNLILGVITDRDIITRACVNNQLNKEIASIMTTQPLTLTNEDEDLQEALEKMAKMQIRRLPVMENGKIVGVLAVKDVIQHKEYLDYIVAIYQTNKTHKEYQHYDNGNPHDSVRIDDFPL